MAMYYKCVIVVLLYQLLESINVVDSQSDTHIQKKAVGFLFSMPKTLVSGKNETVCLSLHEASYPAEILVDLKWREKHYTTLRNLYADSTCFEINVPQKNITEPQFFSIRVQVQIRGEIYSAHNQDPVLLYPSQQNRVFIETDRGIYKPGDTVKFMILQLRSDFLPDSKKISDIRIKNPMGITVMAWQDINPDHGLISLEYQMVAEAMVGKWKLQVENQTKNFEVAKYNIPRFKIELKYPKVIYNKAESVNIFVCGRYSYNKPVAGIAFIKISNSVCNMESVNKLNEMVNGCSDFKVDNSELGLHAINGKSYDAKVYLHITATVTEYGTNKMDVATGKSRIVSKGGIIAVPSALPILDIRQLERFYYFRF